MFPSVACLHSLFRFASEKWEVKAPPSHVPSNCTVHGFNFKFLKGERSRLICIVGLLSLLFCELFGKAGKNSMLITNHSVVFLFIMKIMVP